jgi:ATP-dependent DNA ligase
MLDCFPGPRFFWRHFTRVESVVFDHLVRVEQHSLWRFWYTPSSKNFDALVIGYYEGGKLMYAARTRNGFTPASRAQLFKKLKPLEIEQCPFANRPEKKAGRWGAGLTAEKMKVCRWLKPKLVGQFEFVEWTDVNHLRHTKFIALPDDKKAKDVVREA